MPPAGLILPFRERIGDELVLHLHEGQTRAWNSDARIVAMLAGTQGGKTCFAPHWMYREITMRGEGDYIAGTATFPLLKLKMLPEYVLVICELLKWGTYKASDNVIISNDGKSRIIFFSATNPESIESATAKAAHLDEAGQKQFLQGTWEAVNRRLALSQGRILITTTLYGLGWLKNDVYDAARAGDKNIEVVQFDSLANPAYPPEEYERARSTMPPWKFAMFQKGQFEQPAGLIYDSFQTSCYIDRFPIPKNWLVYSGHDFGGANPAAMFYAQDPATGLFYAFHEYLPGAGRSTAQHVEEFKKITEGYNVIKRAGGSHQEDEIRQGYAAHGWPISESKNNSVEAQIDRVYGLHKLNKVMVFKDLVHYRDEKDSFSRELDVNYNPTDKIDDEARFHLMAAERYILSDFTPETATQGKGPEFRRGW
jgi:Terminase large subunit, T4likevirus-type, N-terminal